jgi:hypothetical protein
MLAFAVRRSAAFERIAAKIAIKRDTANLINQLPPDKLHFPRKYFYLYAPN